MSPAYDPPSVWQIEAAIGSGQANPEDPPATTAMRILGDVGGTDEPQVLAVETSTTGQTALITRNDGSRHRLQVGALLAGKRLTRGDHWYELYRPDRYRDLYERHVDPGPAVPEPTHLPTPTADADTGHDQAEHRTQDEQDNRPDQDDGEQAETRTGREEAHV